MKVVEIMYINNTVLATSVSNTGTGSSQRPAKETTLPEYAGFLLDSSDSEQEFCPAERLPVSWENLPILERLGLSSGAQMTEEEVENAFIQVALAFHCDQYTLAKRLHAEEHDRTVAQYNLNLELEQTRDTLQCLRGRCLDAERSDMLRRIEVSLDTVLGGVSDIITAAEMLGAVHQEARVCRSVEMMEVHLEHLKHRQAVDNTALLQARMLLHSRGRRHSDSGEGEVKHLFVRRDSQQTLHRRRVSITLIPTGSQLSDLEMKYQEGCMFGAQSDGQGPEGGSVDQTGSPPPHAPRLLRQSSVHSSQSLEDEGEVPSSHTSSLQTALRHRPTSATLFTHEASSEEVQTEVSLGGSLANTSTDLSTDRFSRWIEATPSYSSASFSTSETPVLLSQQHPLVSRMSYYPRMVVLLLALSFLLLLGILAWGLKVPNPCSIF